jgi:hypothetical protein
MTARRVVDSWLFDSAFYIAQCDDLSAHASPIAHYLRFGRFNGLQPHPLFDAQFCRAQCPLLDEHEDPLLHYIESGSNSMINPHPLFHAEFYCSQDINVQASGLTPLGHYLSVGAAQGANPNEFFDTAFYLEQVPEVLSSRVNPLVHYLLTGAAQGFDPSPRFHTSYYLEQNADARRSGMNPLVHFLNIGRAKGRAYWSFFRDPEASLLSDFTRLHEIEPLLPSAEALNSIIQLKTPVNARAGRAYFKLAKALAEPLTYFFLVPSLSDVEVNRVSTMVRSIAESRGARATHVFVTDSVEVTANDRLPRGVRVHTLDNLYPGLTDEDKMLVLVRLIVQTRPALVMNTHSVVGWKLYEHYGRQLAYVTQIAACVCDDSFDSNNEAAGLPMRHLNSCMDNLSYFLVDSDSVRNKLIDRFAFSEVDSSKLIIDWAQLYG